MRSRTSSHRRAHRPAAPPFPLLPIAELVDELGADEPGHLLVHVVGPWIPKVTLGVAPIARDVHPFTELAGFTAPADWSVVGLRTHGRARHLDDPHRPPEPVRHTLLVDRHGTEASVLRAGDEVTVLPGRAEGTIADLLRRVLGLPTAPPPAESTRTLWMLVWVDRLMAAWNDPAQRHRLRAGWAQLAALHPAVDALGTDPGPLDDPASLVGIARAHADAWPWARLRAEPDALPLPDGHLPAEVTTWMDDGFYARWAVGAFPPPDDLVPELLGLIAEPLRSQLRCTLLDLLAPGALG